MFYASLFLEKHANEQILKQTREEKKLLEYRLQEGNVRSSKYCIKIVSVLLEIYTLATAWYGCVFASLLLFPPLIRCMRIYSGQKLFFSEAQEDKDEWLVSNIVINISVDLLP